MILLQLFLTFFEIGAFTFGGGYAMLPMIRQEVLTKGWMTKEQIVDFIAVSESTPGPFAVNVSTYIGARCAGFPGAVAATLGVVLPSFIVILLVAKVFDKFRKNRLVEGCMSGLRPAVVGLIGSAIISIALSLFTGVDSTKILITAAILAGSILLLEKVRLHPILIIVIGAIAGIACGLAGML